MEERDVLRGGLRSGVFDARPLGAFTPGQPKRQETHCTTQAVATNHQALVVAFVDRLSLEDPVPTGGAVPKSIAATAPTGSLSLRKEQKCDDYNRLRRPGNEVLQTVNRREGSSSKVSLRMLVLGDTCSNVHTKRLL